MLREGKGEQLSFKLPLCLRQLPHIRALQCDGSSPTRRAAMRPIHPPSLGLGPLWCSTTIWLWEETICASALYSPSTSVMDWGVPPPPLLPLREWNCLLFRRPLDCTSSTSLLLADIGLATDSFPRNTCRPESAPNLDARTLAAAAFAAGSRSYLWI